MKNKNKKFRRTIKFSLFCVMISWKWRFPSSPKQFAINSVSVISPRKLRFSFISFYYFPFSLIKSADGKINLVFKKQLGNSCYEFEYFTSVGFFFPRLGDAERILTGVEKQSNVKQKRTVTNGALLGRRKKKQRGGKPRLPLHSTGFSSFLWLNYLKR